jgi:hypothetical protein
MDIRIIRQQTLLGSMVEIGAVVYGRDFRGRAAEDLGLPGVEVGIEVDYGDGTVSAIYGAQEGEGDCVVTAKGYLRRLVRGERKGVE